MQPGSSGKAPWRVPRLRSALLLGAVGFALLTFAAGGIARAAKLSDQNSDGVVDLADLVLFSQSELGQDWQTVDWCQWLSGPHRHDKHLQSLLDFINDHFRCEQGDPLAIQNANHHPTRLAWSPDAQQLFVTDPRVGSVFIYDSTLALTGEIKTSGKPLGVAVHPLGDVYVGNDARDRVEVYSPAGLLTATIGEGSLQMPNDLAFDGNGLLYVVDSQRNRVEVFDPATGENLRTIGAGQLRFPSALAISGQEIFVADQANFRVRVFDLQGNLLRSFGSEVSQGFMNYNWKGRFVRIQGLAVDSAGRLHALDCEMGIIQILNASTGAYIDSYGTKGSAPGELDLPLGIDISAYGETAVANTRNERVELLTPP
jgi:DNA-binding beta-propeller fold protein YncE